MQITVDTNIDDAGTLHRVGLFLVNLTATFLPKPEAPAAVPAGTTDAAPEAPAIPPAPDFAPSDSLPPSPIELGQAPEDTRAAAVFGAQPQPAGLDGHGPNVPPPPTVASVAAAIPAAPATPQAPVAPVVGGDVDSAGVPWNAELHAGNKAKKQDGTWKAKKGLDKAAIPPAPAAPLAAAPATVPVPPVPNVGFAPSAVIPPAPPSTAPNLAPTFRDVMQKMNAAIAAGKCTKADTDQMLVTIGLKADELAPLVMPANATLLAAFAQLLDAKVSAA